MKGRKRRPRAVRQFTLGSAMEERALQAWLILIGNAAERRTVTYGELSERMFGKVSAGVLAKILGCIAYYCENHGLPPLNCIVVGKFRGTPGRGIPTHSDEDRERVYRRNWFQIYPPMPGELRAAWDERG